MLTESGEDAPPPKVSRDRIPNLITIRPSVVWFTTVKRKVEGSPSDDFSVYTPLIFSFGLGVLEVESRGRSKTGTVCWLRGDGEVSRPPCRDIQKEVHSSGRRPELWTKATKVARTFLEIFLFHAEGCRRFPANYKGPGEIRGTPGKKRAWYRRTSISGTTSSGKKCLSGTIFHAF
jgi:hypothetical protein